MAADPRKKLKARIATFEAKLAVVPKDRDTVEASIRHASNQIAYWKLCQALASAEARLGPKDDRAGHKVESRKCAEMAAEWERRKAESEKNTILRKLEQLEEMINAKAKTKDRVASIATG